MSTRRTIDLHDGIFFVTFTCYQWMPLFEIGKCYNVVYTWFDNLISKGYQIAGYVIMPNHVHVLVALRDSNSTINSNVSNGKRFMAYAIIKQLGKLNKDKMLEKLKEDVTRRESQKGQVHRVFEPGFDVKEGESTWFIEQKLNYMHLNPCSKKWKLVVDPVEHRHSSMKFYETYSGKIKSKLTPYTALFEEE